MLRKKYFSFLWVVILFFNSRTFDFCADGSGERASRAEKADGSTVPVADALVEVFRTDIKAKFPADKTDKKGYFNFAGLPVGASFVLSVSATGVKPGFLPNIKAGAEKLLITVVEGDGKRWTEEEIRGALTAPATGDDAAQKAPQTTAEQKKLRKSIEKVAEVTAKNERVKNNDALIQKVFAEGNAAFKEKNFDLAISKFDEGVNAEPNFAGSAPILLNAKGAVLKDRGFASYAQGAKATDAATKASMLDSAKKDWNAAVDSFSKGLAIYKTATAPDAAEQKNYDASKMNLLKNSIEVHRLMSKSGIDKSKAAEAKIVYEEYFAVETDAALKSKAQLNLGDILREAGDSENAIAAYRKALESSPDNADALAGIGLSLFNSGVVADNKEQKQEGLNFMQKFADTAPETHPLKASVRDAVEYLKTQDKLTPQKTGKSAATKKKS